MASVEKKSEKLKFRPKKFQIGRKKQTKILLRDKKKYQKSENSSKKKINMMKKITKNSVADIKKTLRFLKFFEKKMNFFLTKKKRNHLFFAFCT